MRTVVPAFARTRNNDQTFEICRSKPPSAQRTLHLSDCFAILADLSASGQQENCKYLVGSAVRTVVPAFARPRNNDQTFEICRSKPRSAQRTLHLSDYFAILLVWPALVLIV